MTSYLDLPLKNKTMVNLKETHIITKDNETILFHYPSYTLISINDHIKEILEMIKSGISLSEISLKKNILEADIKKLLVSLNKVITKNLLCKEKGKEIKGEAIHRITLHISMIAIFDVNIAMRMAVITIYIVI